MAKSYQHMGLDSVEAAYQTAVRGAELSLDSAA
jgi:hypothetical protein